MKGGKEKRKRKEKEGEILCKHFPQRRSEWI